MTAFQKMCGKSLIWLVIVTGLWGLAGVGMSRAESPSWLAFGDLRGYLEPCGCDPRTDLGGIKRLASYIQRERAMGRDTLVMSLGNNHSVPIPVNSSTPEMDQLRSLAELKAPFFEEALSVIGPDAALANVTELSWILRNQGTPRSPMVLSNATDSFSSKQYTKDMISISGQGLVLGYTWDNSLASVLVRPSPELAKKWRAILRQNDAKGSEGRHRHQARSRILLFSGPDDHLSEILKWRIFDLVVSSNRAPLGQEPGIEERANPAKLVRVAMSGRQKSKSIPEVLMVPLGGQGILRGGNARLQEAKPLAEIFAKPSVSATPAPVLTGTSHFVSWLDSVQDTGTQFDDLFSRYRVAVARQFEARSRQRLVEFAATPFAGAEACKGCHVTAYEAWSKSGHAKAYATLLKKSAHMDGECVSCHVVGGNAPGGFVSIEASPGLAGVQCESCHGPRKAHVLSPMSKPTSDPRSACVSCHKLPHSSQFKYEDYWPRIIHGK